MLTSRTPKYRSGRVFALVSCSALTSFVGCGGKDDSVIVSPGAPEGPGAAPNEPGSEDPAESPAGHLVIVTERESPEANLQYLHVLEAWPENAELAYDRALELGEFVNVHAMGDSVFVHQPEDSTVRKLTIGPDGGLARDQVLSFAAYGVTGPAGDMVYASPERAYFVDEAAAQIISWNPASMEVLGTASIAEDALTRGGLRAQISRGIALGGQGFVAASWRDWATLAYHDAAAVGVFDAAGGEPGLRIIEDERCASSVTTPFDGGDGFVYLVSDAALGFDALANPTRTEKTLCVLRMRPGADQFDPEFFVDLGAALDSPGFYAAHPMSDGKLLVNLWSPEVDLDSVRRPTDSDWYWEFPPYFEFSIVDLATGTATRVTDIERAAVQWSITLRVDGETFVQIYREDQGSDLLRVGSDATVARVLSNPAGADVQYLGRVGID